MRKRSRREFVQLSATLAGGAALARFGPLESSSAAADAGTREQDRVVARRVPLGKVRLTGGPLKRAQDAAAAYLIELEPDRMMAYYRTRAGLVPKAKPYAGWDGDGRNLTGHLAGHYLSAVSLMYEATGDTRFQQRADYLVREMKEVQDKNGDGYLSALAGLREAFGKLHDGEIHSAAFDLNGLWSPWYTLHKTFAGLRDAHRHAGNADAIRVETNFAEWAARVVSPLSDEQLARMLNTEHGGMNEVLADLYVDTGDERWLTLSRKFEHHAFTDALARHQDVLPGKHGNCQIPKLIGSAARYEYTGDGRDLVTSSFFWDRVAQHHSYATGGHGLDEYFGYADRLSTRVQGRTCESCNVYNMLKLTRRLFSFRPDPVYADFHEQALFNHALASFDPEQRRMSYMVPVGRAEQQEYQRMFEDFTCCMGTGMENHALHGDGIYYEADGHVWVNIFAPSTAALSNGVQLAMDSSFPDGDTATISVSAPRPVALTLHVRRPGWAGDGFIITVNGDRVNVPTVANLRVGGAGGRDLGFDADRSPSSYVELTRTWKTGDVVELTLPKSVRLAPTPDDASVAAITWGPLVLAGDLGPRNERRGEGGPARIEPPVLAASGESVEHWVVPSGARAGEFRISGVARRFSDPNASPTDVALTPFYRTHGRTYSVYFDVLTPAQFDGRVSAFAADRQRRRELEAATVAFVQPGEASAETRFNYKSDPSNRAVAHAHGRTGRGGSGWFSYELPVDAGAPTLVVTYYNDLGLPVLAQFDILVNGTPIGEYSPNRAATAFWDDIYDIPAKLIGGKNTMTVTFRARGDGHIAPVYGIRVVRSHMAGAESSSEG
ncbi:MAG TPA: beta-L-arabinofuranosidase domain-containing protein [Gemmatimonadaceae bacterium]